MNALLLRNLQMRRANSLQSFKEYRALEAQNPQQVAVTQDGALLEFETLELRLHPPNVVVDNESYDDMTVITIDSANRPGTLIEVVQCLTELNLSIRKARISSDGGWFVDEFFVTETPRGKVINQHKLDLIRRVLNVDSDSTPSASQDALAVFELSGRDQRGLLSAVLTTMASWGCDVQSVAVWTYHNRVAMVVGVKDRKAVRPTMSNLGRAAVGSTTNVSTHGGAPEPDSSRMEQMTQILCSMLGGEGAAHVAWEVVVGEIHHERRLHHLLLLEEERCWEAQLSGAPSLASHLSAAPPPSTSGQLQSRASSNGAHAGLANGNGVIDHVSDQIINGLQQHQQQHQPAMANGTTPQHQHQGAPNGDSQSTNWQPTVPATTGYVSTGATITPHHTAPHPAGPPAAQPEHGPTTSTVTFNQSVALPSSLAAPTSSFAAVQMQEGGAAGLLESMHDLEDANAAHMLRAEVRIQHSPLLKYYLVTILSKDRNKLFFDTVCTLADMQYDVYHGAIDSDQGQASQLFYVRHRSGEVVLDEAKLRQLSYMLECAVQRRFPRGLRVRLHTADRNYVPNIFAALSNAGLSVTRAEVRTLSDGRTVMLDLTLTDGSGQVPSAVAVQRACEAAEGVLADELDPVMAAVAGIGGAAAAAATALRPAAMSGMMHAHMYGLPPIPSSLRAASVTSIMSQQGVSMSGVTHMGLPMPRAVQNVQAAGRFQFAISGSADRNRRGPLGHVISNAALDGSGTGV